MRPRYLIDHNGSDIQAAQRRFVRVTWTHCFIGATAWYRELAKQSPDAARRADTWLGALQTNLDHKLSALELPLQLIRRLALRLQLLDQRLTLLLRVGQLRRRARSWLHDHAAAGVA